jgi:hypothetical protein
LTSVQAQSKPRETISQVQPKILGSSTHTHQTLNYHHVPFSFCRSPLRHAPLGWN